VVFYERNIVPSLGNLNLYLFQKSMLKSKGWRLPLNPAEEGLGRRRPTAKDI
jgi:hypothetical protein